MLAVTMLAHRPATHERDVVPGVLPGSGPGWYLIGSNGVVELGPFASEGSARAGADWMDEHGYGRNPAPWTPYWSPRGMLLGTRKRSRANTR